MLEARGREDVLQVGEVYPAHALVGDEGADGQVAGADQDGGAGVGMVVSVGFFDAAEGWRCGGGHKGHALGVDEVQKGAEEGFASAQGGGGGSSVCWVRAFPIGEEPYLCFAGTA
jgi:hypothetical protein